MQLLGMKVETLHDLFVHGLKEIYTAEQLVIDSLPKMIDAATSEDLKLSFQKHLQQTVEQRDRLEDVFELLDIEPEGEKCEGMDGLLKEGEKVIYARGNAEVRDAGLIAAAQKVEHYEIAVYGTLRAWAQIMGHHDIAERLQMTLDEESTTDQLLTNLAERAVNPRAPQM